MWRAVSVMAAIVVLAVYVSFAVTKPDTVALSGNYSTYPYLSANSPTPLLSATTQNAVPGDSTTIYSQKSIDERFVGMLLHIKWLMNQEGSSSTQVELKRLDRQILSLMDDVGEDLSDLREDVGGGLPDGFEVSTLGEVTAGTWLASEIADAYISDSLTLGSSTTFANNIITPNAIHFAGQVDEYCLTYEGTGNTFEWEICGGGAGMTAGDIDTSAELSSILTDETGSGSLVFATSPTLTTPNLGTPSLLTLTNATGLPVSTGISGLGTGVATYLGTPTSANFAAALTNETGTGLVVLNDSPTFSGVAVFANTGIQVGASTPFTDAAGTLTLQNIDGIDATTENTFESAIDTLANLTSASSLVSVGTITSGTWQGTSIGDAYLTKTGNWTGTLDGIEGAAFALDSDIGTTIQGYNANTSFLGSTISVSELTSADFGDFTCNGTACALDATYLTSLNIDTSAELAGILTDETGTGALVFAGSPTLTGTLTAAAANFSGNVGIASTSLSAKLTVQNTGSGNSFIVEDQAGDTTPFVIDGSGNVGIGTTIPGSLLTVVGNSLPTSSYSDFGVNYFAQEYHSATFSSLSGSEYTNGYVNQFVNTNIDISNSNNENYGTQSALKITGSDSGNYSFNAGGSFIANYQAPVNNVDNSVLGLNAYGLNSSGYSVGYLDGTISHIANTGANSSIINARGVQSQIGQFLSTNSITNASLYSGRIYNVLGTITNAYGLNIANLTNTGTVGNTYGVYVGDITAGTQTNQAYSVYASDANTRNYFAGNVGIGTTTPNQILTVQGNLNLSAANGSIYFDDTKYIYASSTNDSIVFGENAGATFNSGTTENIAIGLNAGRYASTTDDSIYIGSGAGANNTGWNSTLIGIDAGANNSGYSTHAIGYGAGFNNTGGENNFFGYNAGYNNIGESMNFFGSYAGYENTGLYNNNLFGYQSGYYNAGDENNIFGQTAGYNNIGDGNNMFGERAGFNNLGSYNNFFGAYAGQNNTGNYNEMIGYQTGRFLKSTSTVAIGTEALYGPGSTYESLNNVALGYRAGYASANGSGNNILLGYRAADNLTTGNNNIIIGYDVDNISATVDNVLNIGNLIFGTGIDGTGTTLSSGNIGIGTTSPSRKLTVTGTGQFTDQLRIGTIFSGNMGNRNEKLAITNYLTDPTISVYTSRSQSSVGFTATNTTKFNMAFLSNASVHTTNTADWTVAGYPQLVGVSGGADAASGSSGTIERAAGVYSVISAAADSATLKQAAFFQGDAAGTNITHMVGMYLTGLAHGVYNTGLYLGVAQDALTPTSNYAIYDVTGYNSYLSGNLGIGTTTPNQSISLFKNGADAAIEFSTISGANEKWTLGIDDSDAAKFKISSSSALGTSDRFVIDGGGKIGINDSTPDAFFDIDTPTTLTSGTIFKSSAPSATTLTASLVGSQIDLSTNYTATGFNVTGYDALLPNVTNTGAGNYKYRGFRLLGGTLAHNTGAGTSQFDGFYVTNPNITQTTGAVGASGFSVNTGSVTTGGTQAGLSVSATGVGAGTLYGVNISAITAGAGTEYGLNIGSGWDDGISSASQITLSGSAANISLGSNWISGDGGDEGVYVTSAGLVGIGTTTPTQRLQVLGDIRVGTTGSNGCIEDYAGGVIGGTCSSDERLKENIESLASSTPRSYLEALTALTPVTYNWNEAAADRYSKNRNVANLGLIAQDVEDSFPELVSRNDDGFRQVDFRALPFYIIEAMKELWAKVQGHDERIQKLEEENDYLKNRIDEIEDELDISTPLPPTPEPAPETPFEPEVTTPTEPDTSPAPEEIVVEPEEEPTYVLVPAAVPTGGQ